MSIIGEQHSPTSSPPPERAPEPEPMRAAGGSIAPVRRCLLVLLALAAFPGTAAAAPVLVLGPHGRVHERNDRFLSAVPITPLPATARGQRAADRALTAVIRH